MTDRPEPLPLDTGPMLLIRYWIGDDLTDDERARLAVFADEWRDDATRIMDAHPAFAIRLVLNRELFRLREKYRPADGATPLDVVVAAMSEEDRRRHGELVALLEEPNPN